MTNPKNIKALILAGGRGRRLNDLSAKTNKCMIKFHNKHLIENSLHNALILKVKEIVIIVGYLPEQIINKFGNSYNGIKIKYVTQPAPKGVVNAIECAQKAIGNSDFILMLGDEFFMNPDHLNMYKIFKKHKLFCLCGVIKVDDLSNISKTYSILINEKNNKILKLVEKPNTPYNNLMGTGNIIFHNAIFDYIGKTPVNSLRGEKELPDLVQSVINDGKISYYFKLSSTYINVNTPQDITLINKIR